MGRVRVFLEVLASALNEDFRFPFLEIIAFIHIVGFFIMVHLATGGGPGGQPGLFFERIHLGEPEEVKVLILNGFAGLFNFALASPIFGISILKNIAFSFGNDLDSGVVQHVLSYPLKRRLILTAKLLSSIGVPYMLMLGIQVFEVLVLVPAVVSQHIVFLLLVFVASLSFPFLVASLVLILTLRQKRGSRSLFIGIGLYFSAFILMVLLVAIAGASSSDITLKMAAIMFPSIALQLHYQSGWDPLILKLWPPSFTEACLYVAAGYALTFLILMTAYRYFDRRLEV